MGKTTKMYQHAGKGSSPLPAFDKDEKYARAFHLMNAPQAMPVSYTPVNDLPPLRLADFVLQSLAPIQTPSHIPDDTQVFTRAVKDVITAAHDKIITPEEADALIGFLAEQFAARRANQALSRVGVAFGSSFI